MKQAHVFFEEGKLYLIPELPIKPVLRDYEDGGNRPEIEPYVDPSYYDKLHVYEHLLEEAKTNALPVVNQKQSDIAEHLPIIRKEGKLYEWPGTWEFFYAYIDGKSVKTAKLVAPQQNAAHGYTEGAEVPQQPQTNKHVYETSKRNKVLDEAIKEVWKLYDCEIQTKEGVIHEVTKILESLKITQL